MFGFVDIFSNKVPPKQHVLSKDQKNHCLKTSFVKRYGWYEPQQDGHGVPLLALQCKQMHCKACCLCFEEQDKMLKMLEYSYLYGTVELFSPFLIRLIVWCDNMNGSRCHM
jgi:hypothetical protein